MKRTALFCLLASLSSTIVLTTAFADGSKLESVADAQGNLHVPANYRTAFQFLGSWAVAAHQAEGSKQIHLVYASPGTMAAYQKSGHFADGSVLVKEVFETATAKMTTGMVSREDKLKGWFVMVKDSKNTHPGNKLWGDGWGWSWFDAADPNETSSTDYKSDCQSCHVPAQSTDWIYIQGYPALKHYSSRLSKKLLGAPRARPKDQLFQTAWYVINLAGC